MNFPRLNSISVRAFSLHALQTVKMPAHLNVKKLVEEERGPAQAMYDTDNVLFVGSNLQVYNAGTM